MEFTAIDFETANARPHSACQLGVVVVRRGVIVERESWLIRPRPLDFSPHNIRVHGITPADVREADDFAGLWGSIESLLGRAVLVAHNARFDLGVLRACLQFYALPTPDLQFTCTRAIARGAWPGQPGYGLRRVADRLGIEFRHHDALEDAEACARVLLHAAEQLGAGSLEELEAALQLERGRAGRWGCGGPRRRGGRAGAGRGIGRSTGGAGRAATHRRRFATGAAARQQAAAIDIEPLRRLGASAESHGAFRGQTVVFTGLLRQLDRGQAEWLVERGGGQVASSVTKRTSVVVVGEPDERTLRAGRTRSTKQERAETLRRQGQPLRLVGEQTFLNWLGGVSFNEGHLYEGQDDGETAGTRAMDLGIADRELAGGER